MMSLFYSLICICLFKFSEGMFSFETNYYTIQGQVIYPHGSQNSIHFRCFLIIELQDISVSNHFPRTIAADIGQAQVFPIMFNISYIVADVKYGHTYVISAKIVNQYHDILFINDKDIEVKLLGLGRTKFIDIPVVLIRQSETDFMMKFQAWPDLLGTNGEEAVKIIKKETGFSQVLLVTDDSKITKDLRYDRVLVYVDEDGKVMHVPRTG